MSRWLEFLSLFEKLVVLWIGKNATRAVAYIKVSRKWKEFQFVLHVSRSADELHFAAANAKVTNEGSANLLLRCVWESLSEAPATRSSVEGPFLCGVGLFSPRLPGFCLFFAGLPPTVRKTGTPGKLGTVGGKWMDDRTDGRMGR